MLAGNTFEITLIGNNESNTLALLNHTSNLGPYNPIFGFGREYFHPEVKPGSVWDISDGYYNMTNPTGYVFPEVNNSRPFERIRVEEKTRMADFVAHRQPNWAIPVYQQVSNWISCLSTALVIGILVIYILFASCQAIISRSSKDKSQLDVTR
jgi:hypothetical protein